VVEGPPRGRQGRGVPGLAAAVPAAGHQREDRRRGRAAEGAHLHAAGRPGRAAREGRRAGGDQRQYLDEALEITGKRIRATEWLMDNSDWDLMMSVWVSVDRTQHALSNYVAPDHPDYEANVKTPIGWKVRDVYAQLDDAIGSFVSRT